MGGREREGKTLYTLPPSPYTGGGTTMTGISISERRRVIEKIKAMASEKAILIDDVMDALLEQGYKYKTIDNIINDLIYYKRLVPILVRPSDGFSKAKHSFKWRVEPVE
jgi:hypothetical protein